MTTSEGRLRRGSARSAEAIVSGSCRPSSTSMLTSPSAEAREMRMNCSSRGSVRGTISARLFNDSTSQNVL